jgi:uncharacterized protein YjbK
MIELEIKQLLTKEKYHEILKYGDFTPYKRKQQVQLNYYYDSEGYYLYQNDITLRVRQIEDALKMEIKLSLENKGTHKVKQELSKTLVELPVNIDLKQEFNDLALDIHASLIHSLVTDRTSIIVNENIRVDLDKSCYLGVIDYELEIEFNDGFYEEAYQIYKIFFTARDPVASGGKKTRFFEQYFKLKGIETFEIIRSDAATGLASNNAKKV